MEGANTIGLHTQQKVNQEISAEDILSLYILSRKALHFVTRASKKKGSWNWLEKYVLLVIHNNPGITVKGVEQYTGINGGGVIPVFKKLSDNEFISFEKAEHDRRVIHYMLTDKGKEEMERQLAEMEEALAPFNEHLSPRERKPCHDANRSLEKLTHNMYALLYGVPR